jgi:hypothetical protein
MGDNIATISREEALLVFNKWISEGTKIWCFANSDACMSLTCGFIRFAAEDLLAIRSADRQSAIVVDLANDFLFEYAEPNSFRLPPAFPEKLEVLAGLTLGVPGPPPPSGRDKIVFFEVKESA